MARVLLRNAGVRCGFVRARIVSAVNSDAAVRSSGVCVPRVVPEGIVAAPGHVLELKVAADVVVCAGVHVCAPSI